VFGGLSQILTKSVLSLITVSSNISKDAGGGTSQDAERRLDSTFQDAKHRHQEQTTTSSKFFL
jgi:hypothetical protein